MSAERVTEIVSLLRPGRSRRFPESLTAAAIAGDIEGMDLFARRGANLEESSLGFVSPLGAACSTGRVEAARWLIDRGAMLDPAGVDNPPIHSALSRGHCETAAVLLDAGLPIERALWGVIAAATLGRLDMLRWLIGRGIDLDRAYPDFGIPRERALQNAKKEGAADVIGFLNREFEPGPPPKTPPATQPLRKELPRVGMGERPKLVTEALDLVRAAGDAAAGWDAVGPAAPAQRQSLLSFATGYGMSEIVNALLDAGAHPDSAPDGTPPPLYRASEEAQTEVAIILLAHGASPDGSDGKSWLPLAGAALSGELEMVRILLESGAKAKVKPAGGGTLAEHARGPFAGEIRALLESAQKSSGKRKALAKC